MDDFLTAPPTLTPLIAGVTTTTITGTLASQFYLPANWVAVITCLVLSTLVTMKNGLPYYQRAIYYLINAITIFTVSMGINAAGIAATKHYGNAEQIAITRTMPPEQAGQTTNRPFFDEWF
ncbi:MAG: hypothetical protein ACU85E_08920 [Gammaproteobacteria bacterium]